MKAPGAASHLHLSPLTLLAAFSALITLALAGTLIYVFLPKTQGGSPSATVAGGNYITTVQTSSGVHQDGSPLDSLSSFSVGQKVYIVYTITDAGPGIATIKLYDDGLFVDTMSQHFQQRSSYNAYFTFQATKAGDWEADLYWQNRGASGIGSLEQRVTFLVGEASAQPGPSVAGPWAGASRKPQISPAHDMMSLRAIW
ncbi:MAG TPA: hypothetical protein VKT82_15910 [Ktedonobacterales bacterium]|nr:hypothetical protein [Ktedonobacterales bacterium]